MWYRLLWQENKCIAKISTNLVWTGHRERPGNMQTWAPCRKKSWFLWKTREKPWKGNRKLQVPNGLEKPRVAAMAKSS